MAAGLHNQSAVTYHFESRAGLLDAVRERHEAPIAQHRRHLIARLPGPEDRTTRQLVDAHIQPLAAEMLRCAPSHWARLSEMLLLHQPLRFARDIRPSVHARLHAADTVLSELLELTVAHLRHLPKLEAVDRVGLTNRFLNSALARWERDSQADIDCVAPLATFTLTLADLAVTMLNAPSCVPPPLDAQLLPSHPAAPAVPMLTSNVVVSVDGASSSPRLRVARPGHSHSQGFDEEEACQTVRSPLPPTASQ